MCVCVCECETERDRRVFARDRCERGMRDRIKREGGREDGLHTHSSHMSVVSGLWAEMDRGRERGRRSDERRVCF